MSCSSASSLVDPWFEGFHGKARHQITIRRNLEEEILKGACDEGRGTYGTRIFSQDIPGVPVILRVNVGKFLIEYILHIDQ